MIKNYDQIKKGIDGSGELMVSLEFEPYDKIILRPDYLLEVLQNKKVIHLGCTDHNEIIQQKLQAGNYLHNMITYVTQKCVGIDINQQALDFLKSKGVSNVFYGDITQPDHQVITSDHFDFILLGEMLEHIDNPVNFLQRIIENYSDHIDRFMITVPNAFGLPFLNNAFNAGKEEINSDHRYWFTPYTLSKVVYQAGLQIETLQMCLYDTSRNIFFGNENLLKARPLLLDTIVVICTKR